MNINEMIGIVKKISLALALCIVMSQNVFSETVETTSNDLRISQISVGDHRISARNGNGRRVEYQEIHISISNTGSQAAQGVVHLKAETLDGSTYLEEITLQTGTINAGGEIMLAERIVPVESLETIRVTARFEGQEGISHLYTNNKIDLRRQSLFWNDFNQSVSNNGWSVANGSFEVYSGPLAKDSTFCLRHTSSGTETGSLTTGSFKMRNINYEINFWVKFPSSDSRLTIDFGPVDGTKTTIYNGSAGSEDNLKGGDRYAVLTPSTNGWHKLTLYISAPTQGGDYNFTLRFQGEVLMDDFNFGYIYGGHGHGNTVEFSWSYSATQNPHGITTQTDVSLIDHIKPITASLLTYVWDISPNAYTWVSGNQRDQNPIVRFTQAGWYRIRLWTRLRTLNENIEENDPENPWTYRTKYIHVTEAPATRHRRSIAMPVIFYPNPISDDGKLFIRAEGFSGQSAKLSVPTDPNYISKSFEVSDTDREVDLSTLSSGQHTLLLEVDGRNFSENIIKP